MCLGSRPRAPIPPPALPEAPRTPDPSVGPGASSLDRRRRRIAGGGSSLSNILTSPRGVTESAATASKTLLGG